MKSRGRIAEMILPRFNCVQQPSTFLLLRPRLRRHHSVCAVIDHELPIMFAGMFHQSISKLVDSGLAWPTGIDRCRHPSIALRLDHVRAILHALFHEGYDLGLGLEFVSFRVVTVTRLL